MIVALPGGATFERVEESKGSGMDRVLNRVRIEGALEPVFDIVTTARFWPRWHPASEGVGGVTERPFLLGDFIDERGKISGVPFRVRWRVVEHARPSRVVLEAAAPPARITYAFR